MVCVIGEGKESGQQIGVQDVLVHLRAVLFLFLLIDMQGG